MARMSSEQNPLIILLVEDNPADVFLVQEALQEAAFPHVLHVAKNGTVALEFLRGHTSGGDQRLDLVILDLNLPGRNGRGIMTEMQTHPKLRLLPVAVLTTAQSESGIGKEFPHLQTIFAAKTAQFRELVEIIKQFQKFAMQYS